MKLFNRLSKTITFLVFSLTTASAFSFGGSFDWDNVPGPEKLEVLPFDKIHCTDLMSISMTGTNDVPHISIQYQPPEQELIYEVCGDTLYLSVKKPKNAGKVIQGFNLNIKTGPLSGITTAGNCQVKGWDLHTQSLVLESKDFSSINLEGDIRLSYATARNKSQIDVLWANSHQLYLNAYNAGEIRVAGTAKDLILKAADFSRINAQYVRSKRVNVLATGCGFAEVLPLCEFRAFAKGTGQVNYYTVARTEMSITQTSGNVLWMGFRE